MSEGTATALDRAAEHLRAARREVEAATSEVPAAWVWDVRHVAAQIQAARQRLDELRAWIDPDPPAAA